MSFPTRERGLKCLSLPLSPPVGLSFPTRERGLKLPNHGVHNGSGSVVPHAGTWIEITFSILFQFLPFSSFPTRERGLKCYRLNQGRAFIKVVPHAGTWIEMRLHKADRLRQCCRSPRGNVD